MRSGNYTVAVVSYLKKNDGEPLGVWQTNLAKYFTFKNVENTMSQGHLSFSFYKNLKPIASGSSEFYLFRIDITKINTKSEAIWFSIIWITVIILGMGANKKHTGGGKPQQWRRRISCLIKPKV